MTIICGTDFSPAAHEALEVAARLSCRRNEKLVLVHAVAPRPSGPIPVMDLEAEAASLRAKGFEVRTRAEMGLPDEVIVRLARQCEADLIVLGAVGQRRGTHWLLGSVADRVARTTPVPLLLVRDGKPLHAWMEGTGRLRMVVPTDLSPVSDFALDWLQDQFAPAAGCDVLLVYVADRGAEGGRLHPADPIPYRELHRTADEVVRRALRERAARVRLGGRVSHCVRLASGHVAAEIADAADEAKAQLIVVGAHPRGTPARSTRQSVSHSVIHSAMTNVLCVPFQESNTERMLAFRPLMTFDAAVL